MPGDCSCIEHADGKATHFHSAIIPVIVSPGHRQVVPLRPEFITPQDGEIKQDCEINAAKRWIDWAIIACMVVLAIGMLLPFLWLFSMSFRPVADAYKMPPSFLPPSFDFSNYLAVLSAKVPVVRIYFNWVLIAVIVLPLFAPPVIFGGGALSQAASGIGGTSGLALLCAWAAAAVALSPLAMAAACRNALD